MTASCYLNLMFKENQKHSQLFQKNWMLRDRTAWRLAGERQHQTFPYPTHLFVHSRAESVA